MEVDREAPKHSGIQVARIKNPKKQKAKRCVDQFFRSLLDLCHASPQSSEVNVGFK
jgi:hypothetical protein